ncbi:unnamed protein product, partial [Porites evermanni]
MSHIFHGVQFCVDFASSLLSFKEKQEIRRNIVDNGGTLSYILTKQISYLVTANSERTLSSYKGRTAVKNGIAVVSIDFVKKCIKSGKLLDPQPYLLSETRDSQNFSSGKIACQSEVNKKQTKSVKKLRLPDINKIEVWKYRSADAPFFNEQSYEIAKDLVLKGTDSSGSIVSFYSLELHVVPPQVPCSGSRYRLFTHHGNLKRLREGDPGTKECRYFSTVEDALGAYTALYTQQTQAPFSLTRAESVLSHKIGSDKMIQITVSEYCPEEDTVLSPEVANLIDFIWNEATGSLSDILAVPADSIKLEDVEKAEAVLLLLRKSLDSAEDSSVLKKLSDEFFSIIPHKNTGTAISSKYLIAQKQDLCQLIKDMVSVGESTNWLTRRSLYSKYRALKCHIEWLQHESDEFKKIQEHVNASETSPSNIQVLNVFSIMRPVEEGTFSHDIQNKKRLFHSSKVTNFVGILSRGLLMPKIIVEDFGGKRSDAGMLGSGIYFASSASTSAKYSAAASNGTRLMLVNEVALGNIKELTKFSVDLTSAPTGFDSCHGVQSTEGEPSDFKDDEFAIYSGNQQRLRYLVEFVLPGDNVLPRDDVSLDSGFSDEEVEDMEGSAVDLSDVMSVVDPLTKVEAGLKGTGDKPLPLQSVHIRAKLLDLAAQVIVFQAYKNNSSSPIEAKYVFPLDDMAAVCGFEAFINGKHIVGEVKEKEQAHKEYREAISQGHGAYLMDEETPDVFTVSVGNLPPGAQVLIKITYVAELLVEREHICFSLPGSVAPWKRNKALEEITQTDVDTVHIDEKGSSDVLDVSVEVSVEMPFDIRTIDSPSHSIRIKRTATKAVVSLEHGQSLEDGFQLLIGLAEIHVPRMWVERHISKPDSQACMLTFYPEFEAEIPREVEVLFLLDLSCSMKGPPLEDAKKILLMCLSLMNKDWIFNILVFGSKHFELFPSSKRNDPEAYKDAVKFVQFLSATKGSTELWRVLQKLSLLPAVSSADHPRNLFLISDGHVTEEETTLSLIHKNYRSDRLFTFGVGATANRYYLRAMSKAGAGASEFFDSKVKSKWERKVKSQLSKAKQPGLTSVAVSWQQHDSGSSPPVQAPHQILSLFNGSRQVVYGFVDNCTQATLSAEVNGKTVSTMVYTSDLNITTGKILHQLTARALIRDWDEGSLHEQRTGHEVVKRNRKDYIITISKEFSVVSKFTSFVAVEHREKDEKFEEGQGPSIEELVAAEEIDILQYIGWEQKPADTDRRREPCIEEKLEKQLQEAKVLETCAVLQCERLYNDVMKEAHNKLGPDHPLTTKTAYALSNLYESVFGDKEKALQVIID